MRKKTIKNTPAKMYVCRAVAEGKCTRTRCLCAKPHKYEDWCCGDELNECTADNGEEMYRLTCVGVE